MLVKVYNDQFFPADLVLLKSAEPKGVCYVETKNLDGETNLKHKLVEKEINRRFQNEDYINHFRCKVVCEEANDLIYKFEGTIFFAPGNEGDKIPLSSENLLLRGSSLRNTEYVLGMIVYSGH
jgi:magnesium-transporting ATPase (P-type)